MGHITFLDFCELYESINDKNLFKSVFMAGGPGSGKTFQAEKLFKGLEINTVNADKFFEYTLELKGIPPERAGDAENLKYFGKGVKLASSQLRTWIGGMLPLLIDTTGAKYSKILKNKNVLESIGYDTVMLLINTSLDVAIERDSKRSRNLGPEIVTRSWTNLQNNIEEYKKLFGSNYYEIDGDKFVDDKVEMELRKLGIKLLNAPLKNSKGKNIIKQLKSQGGKYLHDLENFAELFKEIQRSSV